MRYFLLLAIFLSGSTDAQVWMYRDEHRYTKSAAGPNQMAGKSWVRLRDSRMVRQRYDQSCGAAAIATILNRHHKTKLSELDVLALLPDLKGPYSVSHLRRALRVLGFDSVALWTDLNGLERIKGPSIALLRPQFSSSSAGHFVVVNSVFDGIVALADPASGNRRVSAPEFVKEWSVRREALYGVLLLVKPFKQTFAGRQ